MPGSDQNINYQIRPSKSIERKMMCELVKEIQIIQGTSELRYIGMGAKYFTDFLLFHNEFGVTDMISIEAERERAMRYEFNKPLKSIQMIYGTTNEVLPQIDQFEEKMNLVWLDYDGAFSEGMLSDIETLCRRLYVGSMFFISCNYSFAGKASEKRSAFEKSVGDYFEPDIEKSRYTNNGIPLIIQELINNLILKVLEKDYIVELKILPYFRNRNISEISAADIREWQNTLLKKGYSQTYLRTVNNQLSCIFNYAVKYYDLPRNPCRQAGTIGKSKADEMNFWTQDEFEQFISCMEDKPTSNCGFMILYWTGCRIGELLALTLEDFDEEEKTLRINKSYQRIGNRDVITDPKTQKGKRTITLPDFLVPELKEYTGRLYGLMAKDRLFQNTTKAYWEHEIQRGVELSGVKRIRLHDLRHSHASLLISKLGAQPNLVADRLGHEKIQTTLSTYSHLYPDQSRKLADQLEKLAEADEN